MDLLALRYFRSVARLEHISRAAEELRVAQPSLSRTIARLEDELGVPLFDRQGRQIRLNRFGALFLRRVERVLNELDDARRELADAAGLEHGSVAVAAETALTLVEMLSAFQRDHPGVDVRLFQATAAEMERRLAERRVDLCVASQPVTGPGLHTQELLREEVLLAVPVDHRLAGRERVTVRELADEPFVTTRPGHWQRALADRLFAAVGLEPRVVCEGDEPGVTQYLISSGLGIGLVPAMSRQVVTELSAQPAVSWVRVEGADAVRVLSLVRRTDAYLSVAAERLADFVVRWFARPAPA